MTSAFPAEPDRDDPAFLADLRRRLIPGESHLLSKRADRFLPEGWPRSYETAHGISVEAEGRSYDDWSLMGVGACVLGYTNPAVDEAVQDAVRNGVATTLNCAEEVLLAEHLVELHPWSDQVLTTRSAGEALAVAVRIARAHTGRDHIAVCGYHGWHDWYLAANLGDEAALDGHLLPGLPPTGVPRALRGTTHAFHAGDVDALRRILETHGDELAAIVMEPLRDRIPDDDWLPAVRRLASEHGVVLVFDEVTAGLRLAPGGSHLVLGVEPDLCVLGKALGNGYAIAAVVGRRNVMQAAQDSFISSTNWTEAVGPTAANATLLEFRRHRVHEHLDKVGRALQAGWRELGEELGLSLHVGGIPALSHFVVQVDGPDEAKAAAEANAAHTLFTKRMLEQGYLAGNAVYLSHIHQDGPMLDAYLDAARGALRDVADGLRAGDVHERLGGLARATGFSRLT